MICHKCLRNQANIDSNDSYHKIVYCCACGFIEWLCNYNKKNELDLFVKDNN